MFRSFLCLSLLIMGMGQALAQTTELLLYCGITMVRPMTEIAQTFEKREHVKVTIAQGGSEDLYQAAKKSGVGDWYLPGEPSYHAKYLKEGLFGDHVIVGYNQMALAVQKGNPKNIKSDPRELLRKDVVVVLGNVTSGSIGQGSKHILDTLGIYPKVVKQAAFLASDSRSLALAMKRGDADVGLTWRATLFFPDNASKLDAIDLDKKLAVPQALMLTQLKSTKHPELTHKFMTLAASDEGQAIFRKFGFLDNKAISSR